MAFGSDENNKKSKKVNSKKGRIVKFAGVFDCPIPAVVNEQYANPNKPLN